MAGYIFLGPETGKKQDAIDAIKEKLAVAGAPAEVGAPEEIVFYAGETPAVTIASSVQNHSLFAQSRLFTIKNAEQFRKEETALIASCMKDMDGETALILVSEETKLAPALDNCVPRENRVIFYEMFENEKDEWVRSFFRREGYNIDSGGVVTILELVENNTSALRRECSRLMLFLPRDRPVTADDVEKWLSHSREESAFTLFSRIAAGDISRSVETLHTLLAAKETATGILAILAWCFRKLRDYLAILKDGNPGNFELARIGLSSPKARGDYAAAARRYNAGAVDSCLALTAEYDILTRASGAALEQIIMDVYLVKIMSIGYNSLSKAG